MILSCPSCGARFSFKRSAFSKATKRRGKCIRCKTVFNIGPLPPFDHRSRPKGLGTHTTTDKQPAPLPKMAEGWGTKRKRARALASILTLAFLLAGFYFYKASTNNYSQNRFLSPVLPELENITVLEIKNLELNWKNSENAIQLSIQGKLSNPSNTAAKSAGVTITLLDENDMPVLVWDYEIPDQVIPPEQYIPFHASIDNPPLNATSVAVRLKLAGRPSR